MKTLWKILGILFGIQVLVVAVFVGIHAYNANKYAIRGSDPHDKSSYVTNEHITSIEGDYLNGFHFKPIEKRHAGTIVVFGGSEGSPNYGQAKFLWEQGYEVLALFFFGQPNQQEELVNVPLEFFDEAVPYFDEGPVTVIGLSKGAELTANLAVHRTDIDNIVVYTPTEYTYQGLSFKGKPGSSFTVNGEPVPFLDFRNGDPKESMKMFLDMILGVPIAYRPTYETVPPRAPNTEEARIKIENFAGHGLLFAGDQDAMWQGDVAARELAKRNPRLEAHIYPEAGHMFAEDVSQIGPGWKKMFGGTIEGARAAKQESDRILLDKLAQWHPAI